MKIGIYSGSFDPIHVGHQMVANYCAQWGPFDEVWLLVSPMNPLKRGSCPASETQRFEMARMVAAQCRNVKASDFEFGLPLPSYTYVTLCRLRESYPEHEFSLIVGSDNWVEFGRWRDSDKIIEEFGLVVFPRPGYDIPPETVAGVTVLPDTPTAQISSTFVRNAISEGYDISGFVPFVVADYIKKEKLYCEPSLRRDK